MNKIKITLLMGMSLVLQNCAPLVVAGGTAAIGKSAFDERTLGTQIDDTSTWGKIRNALASQKKGYSDIGVVVNEGRVLLTGNVKTPDDRLNVVRIVWKQYGVSEVINEIKITESDDVTFKNLATDTWITTQIKSTLLFKPGVSSMNYTIETVNGTVYIFGVATNQDELDTVSESASKVKYVQKVVSYARLKGSKAREEKLKR